MKKKKEPLIGILAGMGPRSTAPFLEKVLDQCQVQYGASDDIDFPRILILSLPTPFYLDQPIDHESMKRCILNGLLQLEDVGVQFIVMPCNSAHIYFETLVSSLSVPFLNMIDIVIENLPKKKQRIALLGTETTISSGLYQEKLIKKGHVPFHNSHIQKCVNEILSNIKSQNNRVVGLEKWKELSQYLIQNKVKIVISACTDLQTVIAKSSEKKEIKVLDAAECLAEKTVIKWLEH